jgi:hypothetical protein
MRGLLLLCAVATSLAVEAESAGADTTPIVRLADDKRKEVTPLLSILILERTGALRQASGRAA